MRQGRSRIVDAPASRQDELLVRRRRRQCECDVRRALRGAAGREATLLAEPLRDLPEVQLAAGVGVPPTTPSLGTLIGVGNEYLFSGEWWIAVFPGAALVVLVLSVNLLGDWLRDVLNPRLR